MKFIFIFILKIFFFLRINIKNNFWFYENYIFYLFRFMEMVLIAGLMEESLLVNGKITKCK